MNNNPLLNIDSLTIGFHAGGGIWVPVTDDVSFDIFPGEIFGLAGESGCGKTVTALSLLRLLPVPGGRMVSGKIVFEGKDIASLSPDDLRRVRGQGISMIFQEPAGAFNPLATMERQLLEIFDYHPYGGDPEKRVNDLLHRVGFPDPFRIRKSYPHELSGGMLQRIGICMALLLKPRLIIADEPTTALDVTIQAQIMELLVELQKEEGTAILFITHNLNLIAQYAGRLAVMYAGRIVEWADTTSFFRNPAHPYSQGLLNALPNLNSISADIVPIPGQVPKPVDFVSGCRFRDRCRQAFDACDNKPPDCRIGDRHFVSCFLYKDY